MNLSTEKKILDLENRVVVARGRDWELGVNGCKLLLLEWISNEICCVAQRTMSRYLQRSMTVEEKIYVYMYVQLGSHAIQWKKCVGGNNN